MGFPRTSAARSASSLEATLEGGATAARFPDAKPEAEGPQLTGVLTTFPLGEGKGLTPTRKQVTGAISASRDTRGLQCRPPASEQGACLVVSQALLRPVPSMQRPGRTFQGKEATTHKAQRSKSALSSRQNTTGHAGRAEGMAGEEVEGWTRPPKWASRAIPSFLLQDLAALKGF